MGKKHLRMNSSRQYTFLIILIIGVLGILLIHLNFFHKIQVKPLEALFSNRDVGLILIDNVVYSTSQKNDDQMYIYRLRDAEKMNLVGQWNFNFVDKKQIALYPHFVGQKDLYLVNENFLYPRTLENLPENITHVSVSPSDRFVLVQGSSVTPTSSRQYFCLFIKDGDQTTCSSLIQDVFPEADVQSHEFDIYWLENNEEDLVIHDLSDKKFTLYNPAKKTLTPIKEDWIINSEKKEDPFTKNIPYIKKVSQYPFYLKIELSTNENRYYWMSPFTQVTQASDKHVILKKGRETFVLHASSGKMSSFIRLPHKKAIIYTPYNTSL